VLTAAVSMLANNVSVATLWRDAQPLTDLETKSTRIEHCAAADHLVLRQTAQFPRHVRQDVHYTHTTHTHTTSIITPLEKKQVYSTTDAHAD